MRRCASVWAVVLAAGEGTRLRSLTTTPGGLAVPKQFCSLSGGPSLLQDAVRRASAVAPQSRIASVVARQHRCWWHGQLSSLPADNIIVQPENRGTAHGILLPLLHLARRDPHGVVVLLPADHYVRDEAALATSLQEATRLAQNQREELFLLGVEPDAPDPELGYIQPLASRDGGPMRVGRFVEKPPAAFAGSLLRQGALWNVFILAGSVAALLSLYERSFGAAAADMRAAIAADRGDTRHTPAMTALYRCLQAADFSREVLENHAARLRVIAAADCGWTDLGTPQRVADTLRRGRFESRSHAAGPPSASLSLAVQHQRLQRAAGALTFSGAAP